MASHRGFFLNWDIGSRFQTKAWSPPKGKSTVAEEKLITTKNKIDVYSTRCTLVHRVCTVIFYFTKTHSSTICLFTLCLLKARWSVYTELESTEVDLKQVFGWLHLYNNTKTSYYFTFDSCHFSHHFFPRYPLFSVCACAQARLTELLAFTS